MAPPEGLKVLWVAKDHKTARLSWKGEVQLVAVGRTFAGSTLASMTMDGEVHVVRFSGVDGDFELRESADPTA
ncbi:MAG: hypothetical protein M3Q27_18755 [Actinomycetota bacterium]|nr:hypothetical protein [Actinomycetota bacterium]